CLSVFFCFFFQAEDGIRDATVTGVQTCALPIFLTLTAVTLFLLAPVLILVATRAANSSSDKRKELWDRYRSWIWLALFILIPILAGAFWTILAVGTLSFLCYREYARITGLFRERTISLVVVIGVLLINFFFLGHLIRLYVALFLI